MIEIFDIKIHKIQDKNGGAKKFLKNGKHVRNGSNPFCIIKKALIKSFFLFPNLSRLPERYN
jgi:hypothetical protein